MELDKRELDKYLTSNPYDDIPDEDNMDRPTEEQIKEFWEWCGFTNDRGENWEKLGWFASPLVEGYPSIDLNNLFKYFLLPLLERDLDLYYKVLALWHQSLLHHQEDPAISLFYTGLEVLHGQ